MDHIILSFWPVDFPDETGKMSEGQKRGAPPKGLKAYFLQTQFILSDNRFSFSEEGTTAFRVRFSFFGHHPFPRTPFIPCRFIITITYRTPLVLKGRSLYRYWNLQIIFVCSVFLSLSARQVRRKLGVFLDPSRVGLRGRLRMTKNRSFLICFPLTTRKNAVRDPKFLNRLTRDPQTAFVIWI